MLFGTCSWKYPSWVGLVYSSPKPANYLSEYAQHYRTVEVDQWFWSLFDSAKPPVLPRREVVDEYAGSVPPDFRFSIKVPNALTLTHAYRERKSDPLRPNPHFLSVDLLDAFLDSIAPLKPLAGPLMLQFEYLNREKMPSLSAFIDKLDGFFRSAPSGWQFGVECRNPNYLARPFFDFLASHGLAMVFVQGYYMPPVWEPYSRYGSVLHPVAVLRLMGPDRPDVEQKTSGNWNRVVDPRDAELGRIARMLADMEQRHFQVYVNVNNHYEGSAPLTISRLREIAGS